MTGGGTTSVAGTGNLGGAAGSGGVVGVAGTAGMGGAAGMGGSAVAGAGGGGTGGAAGGGYRRTITLDTTPNGANVTANVDKYPLAIQLDATNFDFAQAQPMGADVRFEKMDGTALPHSIEHWDATGKTAALWVKVDQVLANTAQTIRMRWGVPGAGPAADTKAVFSTADGFYGVWHLDEDGNTTAGGYKDSSGHEAHGTGVNMVAGSRVNARIGKGIDLVNPEGQNTARWVRVDGEKATAYNTGGPALTVSIWALAHSYPIYSYETIMSKGDTSWSLQRVQYEETGYQSCLLAGSGTTYHLCGYNFAAQPLVTEQWLHFMLVLDEPNMTLYINGNLNRQVSGQNWNQGNHPLGIGNQTQLLGARRQWDGILDEARVMQGARSVSWAKLDFETQKPMQKAVTYGAAEAMP